MDAQTWEARCDGVQGELQGGWKRVEEGWEGGEAGEGLDSGVVYLGGEELLE